MWHILTFVIKFLLLLETLKCYLVYQFAHESLNGAPWQNFLVYEKFNLERLKNLSSTTLKIDKKAYLKLSVSSRQQLFFCKYQSKFLESRTGAHTKIIDAEWRESRANILKYGKKARSFRINQSNFVRE